MTIVTSEALSVQVTPGAVFFLSEIVQAKNRDRQWIPVIVSYDTLSTLSLGSNLEDLNLNTEEMITTDLLIKTLYNTTKKVYEVCQMEFKQEGNGPKIYGHANIYKEEKYRLQKPVEAPTGLKKYFKGQLRKEIPESKLNSYPYILLGGNEGRMFPDLIETPTRLKKQYRHQIR